MARWAKDEPNGSSSSSSSQRRKWNLDDRTSLRNLHGHSTVNGDSNSQYLIAKQILENDSEDVDSRADYSLGIDWLLKASYEGHEGALILLSKSLKSGRGINDRNITEVETCLAMTSAERSARKAARELFNCLKQTNNAGEHYITVAQLEKKMRQIYKLKGGLHKTADGDDENTIANEHDISPYHSIRQNIMSQPGNNISEANLISAAMQVVHGQLPSISSSLTLSVPHPESLNHIPYFHRLLFHPLLFLYLIYHNYLNALLRFPSSVANILVLVMLVFYTQAVNNLLLFVPIVIYHISMSVMFISTLKMCKAKHRYDDFRIWSQLFLNFDQQFDTNAENAFLRKEMQPYLTYFSAFFVNVIISPAIPIEWKFSSEITIVSFLLVFVTLLMFMRNNRSAFPDLVVLLSFGIHVLVKYPFDVDAEQWKQWIFFDLNLPTFATYSIGNGIEFCINCRALLYLLIPGLLVTLAHRHNWHGIYQCVIPHCVTLSWLQICIINSQAATTFEIVRGTLSLLALLFCLPLFGMVTLMVPVFVTVDSLALSNATHRLLVSILVAGIALIGSCLLAAHRRTKKYITVLQIIICMIATLYASQPYVHTYFDINSAEAQSNGDYQSIIHPAEPLDAENDLSVTHLKWDLFQRHCYTSLQTPGNRINAQLRCDQFDGAMIKWEGTVTNVEIQRVHNTFAHMLSYMPNVLAQTIMCWMGERNELMYDVYTDELDYVKEQNKCNLNNWNSYEFRVGIQMDYSSIELYLSAAHRFVNFTRLLDRTDRIWFGGKLITTYSNPTGVEHTIDQPPYVAFNLEKHPLWIDLTSIGCINCKDKNLNTFYMPNHLKFGSKNFHSGIKYLFNVLFNPLIRIN